MAIETVAPSTAIDMIGPYLAAEREALLMKQYQVATAI